MELLDALEAEKLMKQKWKQYCGTPCILSRNQVVKTLGIGYQMCSISYFFLFLHDYVKQSLRSGGVNADDIGEEGVKNGLKYADVLLYICH